MARITPPIGYDSWNQCLQDQIDALGPNPDPAAIRLLKRDIKIGEYATIERSVEGTPSYRILNVYTSPGTVSPEVGHPWTES